MFHFIVLSLKLLRLSILFFLSFFFSCGFFGGSCRWVLFGGFLLICLINCSLIWFVGGEAPPVFEISGVIKFAETRGGCRQRLYRIAEEKHAKTSLGVADDGISYQGITKHLRFKLVFKEEAQAEEFRTTVKKIPLEYRKRKRVDQLVGL